MLSTRPVDIFSLSQACGKPWTNFPIFHTTMFTVFSCRFKGFGLLSTIFSSTAPASKNNLFYSSGRSNIPSFFSKKQKSHFQLSFNRNCVSISLLYGASSPTPRVTFPSLEKLPKERIGGRYAPYVPPHISFVIAAAALSLPIIPAAAHWLVASDQQTSPPLSTPYGSHFVSFHPA